MANHQLKLQDTIEPEIVEQLALFAYRQAGEANLALPRIFSSVFWVLGGIFLFLLAKELTSPDGALLTASFYLYLPYGVYASRSFQPDPLMVMLIAGFVWAMTAWKNFTTESTENFKKSWLWAALAGLFGGTAILVKMTAVFFVAGAAIAVVLAGTKLTKALKHPQVWLVALLTILPTALYTLNGILAGDLSQQFGGRFFPELLIQPSFYLRWGLNLEQVLGYLAIPLAILGFFLFPKDKKAILLGLWGGYIVYGLYFNYHFSTHDYYQTPFILVVALSLAPFGEMISGTLRSRVTNGILPCLMLPAVWTLALLGAAWTVRAELRATDYRPLAQTYREVGDLLREEGSIVALAEDYGYRLNYWGWLNSVHFPSAGDLWYQEKRGDPQSFSQIFNKYAKNRAFFLVTDFDEWEKQDDLRKYLSENYPIYAEGAGYLVFDLR